MSKYRELFEADEWEWFLRLGKAKSDPEEKKAFFDGVIERKLADKNFSLFDAFPNEEAKPQKQRIADQYAGPILSMLKESNAKLVEKTKTVEVEKSKELKEWGEAFGAHVDAELARKAEVPEESV